MWAHNSDILVRETEKFRSINESNVEANIIGNLSERIDLDDKISKLKMSIGSYRMHNRKCLEDVSTCTAKTESSTHISGTVDIERESVDTDYDTTLDDDSVID